MNWDRLKLIRMIKKRENSFIFWIRHLSGKKVSCEEKCSPVTAFQSHCSPLSCIRSSIMLLLIEKTTHFNCEAIGGFALRHSPAQDEVGGPAQASQVVGEQDSVLRLRADLVKHLSLELHSNHIY